MSSSDDQGGAGRREVAYRLFAAEFEDADFSYSQSDEERAPNYVVTPTGARVNRLFLVGVLTEVEPAGEDILRARVVDPTGAFVIYAGQYQPEAQAFFERASAPSFVAVTGKARTFQPDDSDVTYTSVRPENVNEVTAETRDRWTVQTARQTLDRVSTMARALRMDERGDDLRRALEAEGVDVGLAAGIPLAIDHYGTSAAYLDAVRNLAAEAAEVVTGDRDEVEPFTTSPDAPGEADLDALAALDVAASIGGEGETPDGLATDEPSPGTTETAASAETDDESQTAAEPETTASAEGGDPEASAETDTETPATAESETTEGTETTHDTADTSADTIDASVDTTEATDDTAEISSESSDDSTTETTDPGDFEAEPVDTGVTESETASPDADASSSDTDEPAEDASSAGDIGDFEGGEFDLDDDEREEIEAEFGTEFQSGTEVDDPGKADIDTPEPEETAATDSDATEEPPDESEPDVSEPTDEAVESDTDEVTADPGTDSVEAESVDDEADEADEAPEPSEDVGDADAADVDIETAVMDAMREHDDGDGASEAEIVDAVTARLGVGEDDVSEAIQDALMGGQCYEPDDGVYKPI